MNRFLRGGAALLVPLLFFPVSSLGAATRLESSPGEALVRIQGPVSLSGTTPFPLEGLPAGSYRLDAQGSGTGWVRGSVRLDRDGGIHPEGELSTAALLLPPGIAHLEGKEGWRGWILLGGGAASAAGVVVKESARRDAVSNVNSATAAFNRAVTEESIRSSSLRLERALDTKRNEEELRNLWAGYLASVWIGAALEEWLLTPRVELSPGADGGVTLDLPPADAWGAGLRSALVPGSGQRYLGHDGRGNLFTAAVLALGAGTLVAQEGFLDARRDQRDMQRRYDTAVTQEEIVLWRTRLEDAAGRTRDRSRLRWVVAGATAGVYLWNVLDAVTTGRRAAEAPALQLSVLPDGDGVRTGITWRLPS